MHDALACQPGERRHREHHELVQLAECDGHDQKRKSADRHGQRHALQHAASHHPPAHRHVVQRKGERAKSSVKDPEQGLPLEDLLFSSFVYNAFVIPSCPFSTARPSSCPSSWSLSRIVQPSFGFKGRFWPIRRRLFQGSRRRMGRVSLRRSWSLPSKPTLSTQRPVEIYCQTANSKS